MRIIAIGHPEAVLGFSLAGVEGKVASTAAEANAAIEEALNARDTGVVLVTREVAGLIRARMDDLKLHRPLPVFVEIPSPQGAEDGEQSLGEVVLRAIGIRL